MAKHLISCCVALGLLFMSGCSSPNESLSPAKGRILSMQVMIVRG